MTWAALILIIKNIAGWIYYHWKPIAVILLVLFLISFGGRLFSRCGSKPTPAIDLESVDKINNENEKRRKEELRKVIEDNAGVIKSVDDRNTLTDLATEERSVEAEKLVKKAEKVVQEAKSNGRDVTQQELVCALQPDAEGCL